MPGREQTESASECPVIFRSIEERVEALLDAIGDIERQRLDGGRRIDASGSDPNAAIDDEQVLDVVATAPFVHNRPLGVGPHPRRAQQMTGAIEHSARRPDVFGSGSLEDLGGAGDAVLHHGRRVVADRVVDLCRGDAVAVFQAPGRG